MESALRADQDFPNGHDGVLMQILTTQVDTTEEPTEETTTDVNVTEELKIFRDICNFEGFKNPMKDKYTYRLGITEELTDDIINNVLNTFKINNDECNNILTFLQE